MAVMVTVLVPSAPAQQSAPSVRSSDGFQRAQVVLGGGGGKPRWARRIDRLIGNRAMGVSVREGGSLYRHRPRRRRVPASNEKLLLAMALLDRLGPDRRISTLAAAGRVRANGVVPRNLWILGRGDPGMGRARMRGLARRIRDAGITRIRGSVKGSTGFFARDWWARGWKPHFPSTQIPLPTALTWRGNVAGGRHIRDPERRAATFLTRRLRRIGVRVRGRPGAGKGPGGLTRIAEVRSPRLLGVLTPMLRFSRNFDAEVLGKLLGRDRFGAPGTIPKGARAIRSWVRSQGGRATAYDSSGLSYSNRISPAVMSRLLHKVERLPWGRGLRIALPKGGQGTLGSRLKDVPVRAKTGTLSRISALSGWVHLRRLDAWAAFSIMSRGMSKDQAVRIENRIVRLLWRYAR